MASGAARVVLFVRALSSRFLPMIYVLRGMALKTDRILRNYTIRFAQRNALRIQPQGHPQAAT